MGRWRDSPQRFVFFIFGWVSVILGIIGLALPLLPTTPFLLAAAYFFSKGDRRWHDALLAHPRLGPVIRDWNSRRVIRPRVKATAAGFLALSASWSCYVLRGQSVWFSVVVVGFCASVAVFILRQKSR